MFLLLTIPVIFASGCTATGLNYYNDAAAGSLASSRIDLQHFKAGQGDRTPVILIHGLWGAELRSKTEKSDRIWGDFSCFAPTAEKKFAAMALSPDANSNIAPLAAADILRRVHCNFFGWDFSIDVYSGILDFLQTLGFVPEKTPLPPGNHYCTLFIYYYDWRKSIDENAAGLAEFIDEKKAYLERQFKDCPKHRGKEVRFDLIGHSMGGLIARYYAEYGLQKLGGKNDPLPQRNWYGSGNIRKLIMIGTPNSGYVDTLWEMVNGVRFDPAAPICPAGVLSTFPSYYQMLPDVSDLTVKFAENSKAADIFDINLWQKYQWGLLADNQFNRQLLAKMFPALPEKERNAAAAEYMNTLLNKASRFKLLFSRPIGITPEPLKYYLFASAGFATNSSLEIDENSGGLRIKSSAPGDGKVTLRSAGFERSQKDHPLINSDIYILDGGHVGIMASTLFGSNLALVLYSEI